MTPKGNPTLRNNSSNPAPNVPTDPDSDPSLSDSSLSDSYDSPDGEYPNKGDVQKRMKITAKVKIFSMTLSKSAQSLYPSYLQLLKNKR